VIAVEKDLRLAALLRKKFAQTLNVSIHAGDFLEYRLPRYPYKVFANIPFNITSAIMNRLTSAEQPPVEATLAMQKEAAEMYLGKTHESLRTILLKPWFEVELVHRFWREDFTPVPRVDVVLLRFRKRGSPLVMRADRQLFRDFVVYGFTTWRPTIGGILKGIFPGQQLKRVSRDLGIDLEEGPASLPFEQWLDLFKCFKYIRNERAMQAISGNEKRLIQQQKKLQKIHRTRTQGWNDFENENSPGR
jgi:23S rRNA (adenine-N6)-dimethyltransferase